MSRTSTLFAAGDALLVDRRRLRSQIPSSDDPIAQLVEDLGGDSAVFGLYLATEGVTLVDGKVSQWDDARGAVGFGPALTQGAAANRPTWNAGTSRIDFDGVNDRLGSNDAAWATLIGASAVACVTVLPLVGNSYVFALQQGAGAEIDCYNDASDRIVVQTQGIPIAIVGAAPAGLRVVHGRRANSGASCFSAGRFGSGAEILSDLVAGDIDPPTTFAVGATFSGGAPGVLSVAAAIVYNGGDWTSGAKYAVFNTFAADELGATL